MLINFLFNTHIGIYVLSCLLFSNFLNSEANRAELNSLDTTQYTISGKIEKTIFHCGGAKRIERIDQEWRKKVPVSGYKLYIKKGKSNDRNAPIIDSTLTNADGIFEFILPSGEYILLSPDHINRDIIKTCLNSDFIKITNFDCLEEWWQGGLAKIVVEDQPISKIYLHFNQKCSLPLGVPCLIYTGPRFP